MIKKMHGWLGVVVGLAAAALGSSEARASRVGLSVFGVGALPASISSGQTESGITFNTEQKGALSFGGGATLEVRLSPRLGLELGGAYLVRKWSFEINGIDTGFSLQRKGIYIPAGLRLHLGRVLSLQAGGFYDYGTTSGASANYGVQGGLRLTVPMSAGVALFADGRYDYGLRDFSGQRFSDTVLGMVGLTFGSR